MFDSQFSIEVGSVQRKHLMKMLGCEHRPSYSSSLQPYECLCYILYMCHDVSETCFSIDSISIRMVCGGIQFADKPINPTYSIYCMYPMYACDTCIIHNVEPR